MKISVLTLARKRSRFITNYIINFISTVENLEDVELLIMAAENDDWNKEAYDFFTKIHKNIKIFYEDKKYGVFGRHVFFQELANKSKGDWILHTCDDQRFIISGWDTQFIKYTKDIDPQQIYVVFPFFDNTGSVDHFISRKYLETIGMGKHFSIDTYINSVLDGIPEERKLHPDFKMMHDFTVDPIIHIPDYKLTDNSEGAKLFDKDFYGIETQNMIDQDRKKLMEAIQNGL